MNGEPYDHRRHAGNVRLEGRDAKLFVPVSLSSPVLSQHPDAHFLRVIGRLKPGVTPQQLEAEVNLLGTRVNDPDDQTNRRYFCS
jgi:hypothetical protein